MRRFNHLIAVTAKDRFKVIHAEKENIGFTERYVLASYQQQASKNQSMHCAALLGISPR
jgi:hypothetical protein